MKRNEYEARNTRANLASVYLFANPVKLDELHQLANWVETGAGVFVHTGSTGAIAASRRQEKQADTPFVHPPKEKKAKRKYTKTPGVLYGRAAWKAKKKKVVKKKK